MIPYDLVSVFTRLQMPDTRMAGARELAAYAGAGQVLVFGKDEEVGLFLPAPGLRQTLRQGGRWQDFLRRCAEAGTAQASMPCLDGEGEVHAWGQCDAAASSIIVFLGAPPAATARAAIAALQPLLGAKLAVERTALAADGHAAAARDSHRRASALNAALDVSRRELQTAYERVERELVSRREAEHKLRDADRRKDEFLAMLAHELRNPLAPIGMAAKLLQLGPATPARLQQSCAIIERQLAHMSILLDDLLDVSRVTGGLVALDQAQHDMRAVVADAIEQARPLMDARRHHLALALPPQAALVRGDGTRLVQVVTNLVNNATRYTPEGGTIDLALSLDAEQVRVVVRDNGIGIEAALLPRVFDLFVQGERSSDRAQGGLGVGLALVKSLVERHGGSVSAASAGAGAGSVFTVCLPRCEPLAGALAPAAPAPPAAAGLDIIVVDDNVDAADTMSMVLDAAGHTVRVAFDGLGALDLAGRAPPRVLLLDIGLPDIDGYELARRLRVLPQTAGATLIALTGYGQPEDRQRSLAAGFDYHLTKPVDAAALMRLLAALPVPA